MKKEEMVKQFSDEIIKAGMISTIVDIYFTVLYKRDRKAYNSIMKQLETGELKESEVLTGLINSKEFKEMIKSVVEEIS